MGINQYLNMNLEELIQHFFTEVINNYTESAVLIEELSKSDRYRIDYEFRTTVETARGITYCLMGDMGNAVSLASSLIDTASSLKLWKLVARNWNTLGITYMSMGMYEKAVECYHNVVKTEKKHGLMRMTSSAYSNIGSIFIMNSMFDRACKYYELAIETIKKGGDKQPRYYSELQVYYSNLALAYSETENKEFAFKCLKKVEELGFEKADRRVKYIYHLAKMLYFFYLREFDKVESNYFLAKANINLENEFEVTALAVILIEKCMDYNYMNELYEEELLNMEKIQESYRNLDNIFVYNRLIDYYQRKNNHEKVKALTEKYLRYMEKELKDVTKRQGESIVAVDELMCKDDDIEGIRNKNTELELLANEAIHHKNSLQKAYHQIDLINRLGKKITSSIKLNEVIELIYENVTKNIPATVFVLMIKNEEKEDVLDTIAFYEDGELKPNVSVNLGKVKGLIAECYYNNKVITSYDETYTSFFKEQKMIQKADVNSAVFMPLNVDGEIIGVCSVQDEKENAYTDEKLEFLRELLPYLSIALNNAIRSRNLEKEIHSHLKTQEELKEANRRLELLSSLDGLTQINGRRIFGVKLMEFIEEAEKTDQTLSIIMLDIDNFKAYNDNYGHLEGDEVLKKVAVVFKKIIDSVGGLAARFGGEEFIAVCIGLSFKESMELAEKIRSSIYHLGIPHDYSIYKNVSVSVGVSVTRNISMKGKNDFIKAADNRLYEAKNSGRNKVVGEEII